MSDGKPLRGQLLNSTDLVTVLFTQQMVDTATMLTLRGQPNVEIIPHDAQSYIVRIYDVDALYASLAGVSYAFPSRVDLTLPPILKSISAVFSKSHGDGASSHPIANQASYAFGSSVSVSLNPRATAQGSAAITPGLVADIEEVWSRDVPAVTYLFYLPPGNITTAQILTKLGTITGQTVLDMPVFIPESNTFSLTGQQESIQASADTSVSGSASGGGASANEDWGSGFSTEVGVSIRTERLPPTLHAELTIDTPTDTDSSTVTVVASSIAISGGVGLNTFVVNAITNTPAPITRVVTGSVTPTMIPATTPTDIPRTGLYLFQSRLQGTFYGVQSVSATVVDFSIFA